MSNDLTYEQLKQAALNATAVAGEMIGSPSPEALEIAALTLRGAQVFATLAHAAAVAEQGSLATVTPIRPGVN